MIRTCSFVVTILLAGTSFAADWTRFRGPAGSGAVAEANVPSNWSTQENLKWRTPLPGKGVSSPVVAGDRIYLTCYTGYGVDITKPGDPTQLVRHLLAFDRASGKEVWRRSVASEAKEDAFRGFITQHGYASSTPAVDGDTVYALLGKSGLFAFDRDGKQLWQADLGQMSDPARWGDATSPIVIGDVVVVDAGILGHKIMGLDKQSGKQLWAVGDKSYTNAWATPAEIEIDGKQLALVHVPKRVMAIDPTNGKVIWSAESPLNDAACGSIVTKDGVAYLMGSRAGRGLAIRCDGKGDVSETKVVWQNQIRSGICTPLIVGDQMYWSTSGIFYAAKLADGKYAYRERLPRLDKPTGGFPNSDYSSAVAIGNRIIQFTRNGESYVIEAGDKFKVLAHNPPFDGDESAFSSSPAVADNELFIRSDRFLYCISGD